MDCKDLQEQLQEFLDGQLSLEKSQIVDAHLIACAICQQKLTWLRQVDEALATIPVLEESVGFTAQVMAQVQATETRFWAEPRPVFRLRWEDSVISFVFACTVMAVLFVLSLLQPQHVSAARAFLHQMWWAWLPELDRLWHTIEMEPAYAAWALSSLCVAAAATASAIVLIWQWSRRPVSVSRQA